MATTINNYSVGLSLDAGEYINAANLSRAETRALTADINKARDPMEKYSRDHDRLTDALNKGAISQDVYERLLDSAAKKHKIVANAIDEHADQLTRLERVADSSSMLDRMSKVANVTTAAITSIRAGIDSVAAMKGTFDSITAEIDRTSKAALQAGISTREYASMEFAVKGAGVEPQQLEMGFKELLKRGFEGDNAHEGLMRLADELKAMESHAERVQYAVARIGDDAAIKLVPFLSQGRDAIEDTTVFADKWLGLTEAQVVATEEYNATWQKVGVITDGITNTIVAEMAPVLSMIGENLIGHADSWEDVRGSIRETVAMAVHLSGQLYDASEIALLVSKNLFAAATMNTSMMRDNLDTFKADLENAMDFSTGDRLLDEWGKKVQKHEEEAAARRKRLESEVQKQKIDNIEEVVTIEQEKAESYQHLYTQSIANAHRVFEEQARKAQQMMDAVARGPSQIEAGSAEAARYMAEATNRKLASSMQLETSSPSEAQLLEEAAKQLQQLVALNATQAEQTKALEKLVEVTSENGFRRIG